MDRFNTDRFKPGWRRHLSAAAMALMVFALHPALTMGAGEDVVRVGRRTITVQDISLRQAVDAAYRGDAGGGDAQAGTTTPTMAVVLMREAIAGEVAKTLGVDATTTECEALAAYADSTSQAPELLARVKAVFGADHAAYLRLYIAPKVVEQKLRGHFVHSRQLHATQIGAIEAAFAEARTTSASLATLAPRHGLQYTTFTLSEAETPQPEGPAGQLAFRKDPMLDLVRPLGAGELFHNIVENDDEFQIVRLLAHEGTTTHTAESLVALKRPFDEWFHEQSTRVPIVFFDPTLADEMQKQYPQLTWWPQVTVQENQLIQHGDPR